MTTTPGLNVNVDVDDLEKATAFYTSTFGLTVGRRLGDAGVEILGTSAPLYFLVNSSGTPASPTTTQVRTYERHWTPVHLDFVVDEVEPVVEKAVFHGAVVEVPIATHKWGRMAVLSHYCSRAPVALC